MKPVQLTEPGQQQAASFENPESMLLACHQRVQRMCTLLLRLHAHAGQHGADEQARRAAADIMRYFDMAGPHHHEDEERHLVPRMLASEDAAQIHMAENILRQHKDLDQAWAELRPLLVRLTEGDTDPLLGHETLCLRFAQMYQSHIELEELHAYPAVFPGMDADVLQQAGEEMAQRRVEQPVLQTPVNPA